jgi:hypothetical protein
MVGMACYDSSVVTACLDPADGARIAGRFRFAFVAASLLALGIGCAPRPAHRAVQTSDAGEDVDLAVNSTGGTGGTASPDAPAATGGTGGAEPPDAAVDVAVPVDLAADRSPDVAADAPPIVGSDARDGNTVDLPPGVDLTVGLVHHWKFDEGTGTSTADSTAKANTGTLSGGGMPWTAGGAPIPGNAFSLTLDGVDDHVALKDGLASVLGATASLSCWIKTTQTGDNNSYDAPGITGVEQGGGSNDIFWGFLDSSGAIGLRPGSGRTVKSAAPVNDNMWHHIVMTRDQASGRIEIYVDGKLAKGDDGMQTGAKSTAFAALGRITDSAKPYFKGQLDDVRIWSRVISATEVAAVFAGQ